MSSTAPFYSLGSSFHRNLCLWEKSRFSYRQIFLFFQPSDKGREWKGKTRWEGSALNITGERTFQQDKLQGKTLPLQSCHLSIFVLTKSLPCSLLTQSVLFPTSVFLISLTFPPRSDLGFNLCSSFESYSFLHRTQSTKS